MFSLSSLQAFERDFGGLFDLGPLGRMFENVEPFLGHIQDMLEDFQRMQQGGRSVSPPGLLRWGWVLHTTAL